MDKTCHSLNQLVKYSKLYKLKILVILGNPFAIDEGISLIMNGITALSAQVNWTLPLQIKKLRLQYKIKGLPLLLHQYNSASTEIYYNVMFAGTEWSYEKEVTLSSSVTGHLLTGLTPETTYEIRLITLNSGSCEQSASYSMNFRTQSEDETLKANG